MKTILVPIDFSGVTDAAIRSASALARAFESDLVLLHVGAPDPDFVGYDPGPPSVRDYVAEQFREEHSQLQGLKHAIDLPEERVTALLIQGITAEKILEEAKRMGADLIVMGSHGHGALHNLLVGSVTEGVLKEATCPVLVVPARRA